MTGISTKSVYAAEALYALGKAGDENLMTIRQISDAAGISKNFLEQILLLLKKSGMLSSVKGPHGGYRLERPLSEIHLSELMEILENDAFENPYSGGDSALELFWKERSEDLKKALNVPLSEILECGKRVSGKLDFVI